MSELNLQDKPALIARIEQLEAENERLRQPAVSKPSIINGWLVESVEECTCHGGGPYGHEPGCGYEPVLDLSTVQGWVDPAPLEATIQRVRGLHTPREDSLVTYAVCAGCYPDYHGWPAEYPCPTIKALEGDQ